MIHDLSDVHSKHIGENTRVWQYVVILSDAVIGDDCNICSHCYIENNVKIGNKVTIKCGVYIWDGITLEDNVFIGPNVSFTNDNFPRSKHSFELQKTTVRNGASIGAGSVIVGGVEIGENSMIGAGSLVTKDVPPNELWFGHPAKKKGEVDKNGKIVYL